jgi:hypothetical protein
MSERQNQNCGTSAVKAPTNRKKMIYRKSEN